MVREVKQHGPLPSQAQLAYLEDELAAFIHFGPIPFMIRNGGQVRRILNALTRHS